MGSAACGGARFKVFWKATLCLSQLKDKKSKSDLWKKAELAREPSANSQLGPGVRLSKEIVTVAGRTMEKNFTARTPRVCAQRAFSKERPFPRVLLFEKVCFCFFVFFGSALFPL